MYFILKSAFCLAIVFLMLPEKDAQRVTSEVTRTLAQDKFVQGAIERTNLATQQVANEAPKLCVKNAAECMETARLMAKTATSRW